MTDSAICVIIPVRNMPSHIAACVESLMVQVAEGDSVLVVDDKSTDASAAAAATAGATVITNVEGGGPYHARNFAVRQTTQPNLLFIDARCRARAGLLDAHRRLLAQPGVALSCTNVEITHRDDLPARVARAQDAFRVERKVKGGPLDFYPTANLGVRRDAFQDVGGFRKVRSGADADLCWRILAAGLGRIDADPAELMSWIPREKVTDLLEQNYRYGQSAVLLERLHAELFAAAATQAPAPIVPPPADMAHDRTAVLGARLINLPYRAGRLRGAVRYRGIDWTQDWERLEKQLD